MKTGASKSSKSSRGNHGRRQFLVQGAFAAAGLLLCPAILRSAAPSSLLQVACIGVGGMGGSTMKSVASHPKVKIVALCDVDSSRAAGQLKKYPNAKFYQDWRVMLEKEKGLDAVIVATPDHMHALVASAAMKLGKHIYCQKPLVQTVYEARLLRKLAKENNLVTQMGNQGSSEDGLRRAVEVVQAAQ